MEETPGDMSGYTYQDPISSFFGGIFFIIIIVLVIIFVVILMVGRAFGLTSEVAAPSPKKETFKDGPPYPSCQTNGAFAMF
jgi:flagellar basal body-associated protein FliL